MFHSQGGSPLELGDIEVIEHDGVLHLFHLVLPNHDLVAHATSADGLHWTPAPVALRTGDPGECDDDQIWTMQVVKKPDGSGFFMYYTACSLREHGLIQRVALAESDDLMSWRKYSDNPILEPKNPYYNEQLDLVGFISFRDPFVFIDDGVWHMLVTGRTAEGPRFRRGCIAHATSGDGVHWKLEPPLYAPQSFEDLEVPALLKLQNRYYVFFNDFGVGNILYRIADSLDGPWRAPQSHQLLSYDNAVSRFCNWQGKTLMYHWLRATVDWPRRLGNFYSSLMPPKEVEIDENEEIRLVSFSGWSKYYKGEPQILTAENFVERSGNESSWTSDAQGRLTGEVLGLATARTNQEFDDFIIEFTVNMKSGQRCGAALRCDEPFEIATWIHLNYATQRVELHRTQYYDSSYHRYKLQKPTLLQSMPASLSYGRDATVRVLACREYIEVSVDGKVLLSAATYKAQSGTFALWVEEGAAGFSSMQVQHLSVPNDYDVP